ncbi:hypothetical protein [Arvimicrobium flavum]|uniref:hypothetical protein n=1 Tax=Arvimicrobium flavum TaxID=3393320 RepID=UPI00237AAC85|nr:hypothetical protein [Mesorhizobium shangrilense]
MKNETRARLSDSFNRRAENVTRMVSNPWFVGATVLMSLAALPLSTTTALFVLSVPTIYHGIGVGCRVASYVLMPPEPRAP